MARRSEQMLGNSWMSRLLAGGCAAGAHRRGQMSTPQVCMQLHRYR